MTGFKVKVKQLKRLVLTGLTTAIAVIAFTWANQRFEIKLRLSPVPAEVWVGIALSIATTYWQWREDREKEKVRAIAKEIAQETAKGFQSLTKELIRAEMSHLEKRINKLAAIRDRDAFIVELREVLRQSQRD